MTYDHGSLRQVLGSTDAQLAHWLRIIGGDADTRPLSRVEAAAIGAVETMRAAGVPRKKLERVFARLALQPPSGPWLLVREPRKGVQIVEPPFSRDLGERKTFHGTVFDPSTFLARLDQAI